MLDRLLRTSIELRESFLSEIVDRTISDDRSTVNKLMQILPIDTQDSMRFASMRQPGWDARRRNKNIGTAKSGRGQNNQMRIPEYWMGGNYILYYEKLENPVILSRTVGDRNITFK